MPKIDMNISLFWKLGWRSCDDLNINSDYIWIVTCDYLPINFGYFKVLPIF